MKKPQLAEIKKAYLGTRQKQKETVGDFYIRTRHLDPFYKPGQQKYLVKWTEKERNKLLYMLKKIKDPCNTNIDCAAALILKRPVNTIRIERYKLRDKQKELV